MSEHVEMQVNSSILCYNKSSKMASKQQQRLHSDGRQTVPEAGRNRRTERTHSSISNSSVITRERARLNSHEAHSEHR